MVIDNSLYDCMSNFCNTLFNLNIIKGYRIERRGISNNHVTVTLFHKTSKS